MKNKIAIVGHGFVPSAVSEKLLSHDNDDIIIVGSSENEGVKKVIEQLNNEGKKVTLISEDDFKKQNLEKLNIVRENKTYMIENMRDEFLGLDYLYDKPTKKQMNQTVVPVRNSADNPKIQNNESCPCGSGNKYKKCCKKM